MNFSAWAPLVRNVELRLEGTAYPMTRGPRGIWHSASLAPADGARYGFVVDGGAPLPDPRSPWQRDGVHGDSRWIDREPLRERVRGPFRARPLDEAVIYEMHLGTFTPEGTYDAARARLPDLAALGISHVELMPIATFPGAHGWGYDGVYLYAPHPAYGTPAELTAFVVACHAHGLAVILDVVYNHLGPDGNYTARYAPYLSDTWKTPWGSAFNFDGPHSDELRDFVIENALMWLRDYGFDGLRLDAVHTIGDLRPVHILEELATRVRELGASTGRDFVLIAESNRNDPRLVLPPSSGGYGLDAHWADDFHHALHVVFTGERRGYYADFNGLPDLAAALAEAYVYQGRYSEFFQRSQGRAPAGVQPRQLIVFSQNHDQVGNRPLGERLSMLLPFADLKAVAALTLLSPFVPLLFQGEEWGARTPFLYFTDHQDEELGRQVAAGRRRESSGGDWQGRIPDPQDPETFRRSQLRWDERERPEHSDLLEWHRRLIAIRRRSRRPGARADVTFDESQSWLRMTCDGAAVAINLAHEPRELGAPSGDWRLELASDAGDPKAPLAPRGTRVWTKHGAPAAAPLSP